MDNFITPEEEILNENILLENILKYEEFYLIKENNAYKFIVEEFKDEILIKYKNYEIRLNNNDLSILTKMELNSVDEAYQLIINRFEHNKVIIKDIIINKTIKLLLKVNMNNIEKDIEMLLLYRNNGNNNYMEVNKEINKLKDEIKLLKNEINKLKKDNGINGNEINRIDNKNSPKIDNNVNNTNNKNLTFLYDIVNDAYFNICLANSFSVFKSINDILYLIYSNQNKSIILYDIMVNKKIKEIKNAHEEYITNFRYYLDKIDTRDLILSTSDNDNNIKLWNIYNNDIECLLNIKNVNDNGYLYSACILNEEDNYYIISSNANSGDCEYIKVFDFYGYKIKEINNSNDETFYIDTFYDNKLSKIFILTGNSGFLKSYDFNKNDVFKEYSDDNENGGCSIIINESEEVIKLIESSYDGNIRIWNFHSAELLKKIKVSNKCLREICLWDNEYIYVGCDDKTIKIIEISNGIVIKELISHKNEVISIKQIIHPLYGKCLISQGGENDKIKLWGNKN